MKTTPSSKSYRIFLTAVFVILSAAVAIPLAASTPQAPGPGSIAGHWTGILELPGQPVLELQPDLGGEFVLKQAKTVTFRFIIDDKGVVTGMESIQPDGTYEGKRMK